MDGMFRSCYGDRTSWAARTPVEDVIIALASLESEGLVFEGRYRSTAPDSEIEWCQRRILARIHRATIGRLRREIEPVSAEQFHRFLERWQHTVPGARLHGADGLLQVIRQLQGWESPASAWESDILARRVARYSPEDLDELCLSGEVAWARLSPHPALTEGDKHVRPTRVAPISFFLREDADWLIAVAAADPQPANLSHAARDVFESLTARGASFFGDLVRAHASSPQRSGRCALGTHRGRSHYRRRLREPASADRPEAAARGRAGKEGTASPCGGTLGRRVARGDSYGTGRANQETCESTAAALGRAVS